MARPRRPVEPPPPNGFVASATRLPAVRSRHVQPGQGWHTEAWAYYDTIGELRFVANWVGNVMSRAVLKVLHLVNGEYLPVEDGPAVEALSAYFGGVQGQAQMLQATGVNLTVTGEAYHVMTGDEEWYVLASGNVAQDQRRIWISLGGERRELGPNDLAMRVWVPHPKTPDMADSPVRSNLQTLSEIRRLNDHISAQLDSRLAGAGVLFVPSEIQFAAPPGVDPSANQADAFMQVLGEAMMTPITDRASASAVVPIVVTAPGEALDKVQHLTFWTPLDDASIGMRDNAVKRLALGLDTPPEVLLGVSDTNHWSAWMVDESSVKAHLEPRLAVVAHAVTTAYLRPSLTDEVADPENYFVMADTSQIRIRPNRSNEAIELYDRGELSGGALRRETGFQETDSLDGDAFVLWLLRKVATGSTSPEQTAAALGRLGADLGAISDRSTNKEPPDDLRTDTSRRRKRATDQRRPDQDRALTRTDHSPMLSAAEVLVLRALERAGNRLCNSRTRSDGLGQVPAIERYLVASGSPDSLLDGAWDFAEQVLRQYCDNPATIVSVLDLYCRGLLSARIPHDPKALALALDTAESLV